MWLRRIATHSAIQKRVARERGLSVLGTPAKCFAVAVQLMFTAVPVLTKPAVWVIPAGRNMRAVTAQPIMYGAMALASAIPLFNIPVPVRAIPAAPALRVAANMQAVLAPLEELGAMALALVTTAVR